MHGYSKGTEKVEKVIVIVGLILAICIGSAIPLAMMMAN